MKLHIHPDDLAELKQHLGLSEDFTLIELVNVPIAADKRRPRGSARLEF